ncbi:MAG TPA: sigma-70 family RNA polymerase sigma factor [Gemmataceae bacterium]|nr:sigma-70 family RNA polymerase sigma factor [Gemmataceae bacterium]
MSDLPNGWRTNDEEAARRLVDQYLDRLVALARRRLSQRLASRVDPEDVVQSVFRTFFCRAREGKFQIKDNDDLCKLLMRITVHKVLKQVEHHTAGKRDPHMETEQGNRTVERMNELLSKDPTPEAQVMFLDQLEHVMGELRPTDRKILEMRMQGYSEKEIAAELNVSDRTIRRVLERVRGLAGQAGLTR